MLGGGGARLKGGQACLMMGDVWLMGTWVAIVCASLPTAPPPPPPSRGKVAGFASRWAELKPRKGPSGNPAVVLTKIEEYAASIQDLREESAKLQKVRAQSGLS